MITDEMVEKAEIAYDRSCQNHKGADVGAMRAALEAVAPMLIAQGILEAAGQIRKVSLLPKDVTDSIAEVLEARAQELDPQ